MGAWTGVLALCMARDSSSGPPAFKCEFSVLFQAFLLRWQRAVAPSGDAAKRRRRGASMGGSVGGERGFEAAGPGFVLQFRTHPNRRFGIGEEDGSEGECGGAGRDQVECMCSRLHSADA